MLSFRSVEYQGSVFLLTLQRYRGSFLYPLSLGVLIPTGNLFAREVTTRKFDRLTSSRRQNRFGDRNCTHQKLTGTVEFSNLRSTVGNHGLINLWTMGGVEENLRPLTLPQTFSEVIPNYQGGEWPDLHHGVVGYTLTSHDHAYAVIYWYGWARSGLTPSSYRYYGRTIHISGTSARWIYSADGSVFTLAELPGLDYFNQYWPSYNWQALGYNDLVQTSAESVDLPAAIDTFVNSNFEASIRASMPTIDLQDAYGPLSRDILDQIGPPQVNLPTYLRDILKTPSDLVKLAKSVKHADLKSLSDAYLSYKYGFSLSVRDTLEIASWVTRGIATFDWLSRRRSKKISDEKWDILLALKVYYSSRSQEDIDLVDELFANDIIGLGNTWDMIPFSFVVDWFLNVGDVLEQLDSTTRYNTLPVESTIRTQKLERYLTSSEIADFCGLTDMPSTGGALYSLYSRVIDPKLPLPKIAWDAPSQFNHYMESGALIISTRYRR